MQDRPRPEGRLGLGHPSLAVCHIWEDGQWALHLMTACPSAWPPGEEAGCFQEAPQPAPPSYAWLLLPAPAVEGWPWLHTPCVSVFSSLVSSVGPDGCGLNEASHPVWEANPGVTFSRLALLPHVLDLICFTSWRHKCGCISAFCRLIARVLICLK